MELKRVACAAMIGTVIEWYDFYIYGIAAALVFNAKFFPVFDPVAALLASYGAYAIGFLIRPIGGIIFGHLGDTVGRKRVLITTILLMGISTGLIGVLPTYATAGVWAPIALVTLRVLQGLGAGGEFAAAVVLTAEAAHRNKGFWSSIPTTAIDLAVILSAMSFALVALLPGAQLAAWGWRIPFILSFAGTTVAYLLRYQIPETKDFEKFLHEAVPSRAPIVELIQKCPDRLLIGMGANVIMNVGYIYQVFAVSYLVQTLKIPQNQVLIALSIAACIAALASMTFGYISDIVGRRPVMLAGVLFTILFSIPFFSILETRNIVSICVAITAAIALGLRPILGVQPSFYAELFPINMRLSAVALSREITSAIFGGPIPLLATWLAARFGTFPISLLIMGMAAMTGASVLAARSESLSQEGCAHRTRSMRSWPGKV